MNEDETPQIIFSVPEPPSTNKLWVRAPGKPRVRSLAYRSWLRACVGEIKLKHLATCCIPGSFDAQIIVPAKSRKDLDNHAKPIFDMLQLAGVVRNDGGLQAYAVSAADRSDVLILLWDRGGPEQPYHNIRLGGPQSQSRGRRWTEAEVARFRRAGGVA